MTSGALRTFLITTRTSLAPGFGLVCVGEDGEFAHDALCNFLSYAEADRGSTGDFLERKVIVDESPRPRLDFPSVPVRLMLWRG
jgi:hypothetical protein